MRQRLVIGTRKERLGSWVLFLSYGHILRHLWICERVEYGGKPLKGALRLIGGTGVNVDRQITRLVRCGEFFGSSAYGVQ